jgi:polysaccharide export outer membrane protein
MASFLLRRAVLVGALILPLWSLAAQGASDRALSGQVVFETRPDGVTVVVMTGSPVPAFTVSVGKEDDPEITIAFPQTSLGASPDPASPSPFLESVKVSTAEGQRGSVIRLRPRLARFAGVEQRGDSVALRVVADDLADREGDADYHVGIGDKIDISVFGHEDLAKTLEVRTDGTISMPLLGDVPVAGKTIGEIDIELTRRLGTDFLVDPEVSVDVREYKSQWVTLMGEVRTPGRYVLRRNMRMIDLLAEAGGPTKDAGAEVVLTRHSAKGADTHQITLALDDILSPGKTDANVILHHGDIVTLNSREAFYIRGEVTRPGPYYIDRGMTILKAISVAGGLTQYGNRKEVQLLRSGTGTIQQKTVVNLKAIEDGHKEDIPLLPNDIIIVPRRIF